MALPGSLSTITVTGTFATGAGTPVGGTVIFTPSSQLTDSAGNVIISKTPITVLVPASTGTFSQAGLVCTDNADLNPASWAWYVQVNVPGYSQVFYAYLPSGLGTTVDLADLAPYISSTAPPAPETGVIQPGTAAGGDLSGTYPSPSVWQTHLTSPLPITQGGTGAATAASALDSLGASPAGAMLVVTTTGASGFALQNGTPTILSWTAPSDGALHAIFITLQYDVTSAATGGGVTMDGSVGPAGAIVATDLGVGIYGPGGGLTSWPIPGSVMLRGGQSVTLAQTTALTAGVVTVYAEIWAS